MPWSEKERQDIIDRATARLKIWAERDPMIDFTALEPDEWEAMAKAALGAPDWLPS